MKKKTKKIKKAFLKKKYNCINYKSKEDTEIYLDEFGKVIKGSSTEKDYREEFTVSFVEREIKYLDHRDYLWDSILIRKMSKYFIKRGGNDFKTLKLIYSSFRRFKRISRVNPIIIMSHIIQLFLMHVYFITVERYGVKFDVPRTLQDDSIVILRTLKMFCDILRKRSKWGGDFKTRILVELLLLISNAKKSEFVTKGLAPQYSKIEKNTRYIHFTW